MIYWWIRILDWLAAGGGELERWKLRNDITSTNDKSLRDR